MKKSHFPALHRSRVVLTLVIAAIFGSVGAHAAGRPNILFLYVDDMGWGSIGPNGQTERRERGLPFVLTPNLERLAATGVNFRRGYGCTVCSPARSSQQTGFHQGHTFADRNDTDNAKKAIRADDLSMGDLLSGAGYNTGYWGKWGYGGSSDIENPTIVNVQTLPTSHGYQHVVAELHHVRAHTFFQPTLWNAPAPKDAVGGLVLKSNTMVPYQNNKAYPDSPARQNHPGYPNPAYCDDVYAFAALDFVRQSAREYHKSGKPFFGLFASQIPHAPFEEVAKLPDWDEAYRDQPFFKKLSPQSQQWCAMVTRIDAHFGNLLAALDDPNGDGDTSDSVAENTLVVFQSDNGGAGGNCRSELASNGILSGGKGSIQEGGIRVPTIIRWPAKITAESKLKRGTSTDFVMDTTDLLPTFCELAGIEAPVGIDGVSMAPMLTGRGFQRPRRYLIHEAGGQASIIEGKYKLIIQRSGKSNGSKSGGMELHDLETDPGEKINLAAQYPELVERLRTAMIAERVKEPDGFANTYHRWTASGEASAADPDNWSNYRYENAGVTHLEDTGAPKLSWIAKVGPGAKVKVDEPMEVLAMEITATDKHPGIVKLGKGGSLTARNELRIGKFGGFEIQGGTLTTEGWLQNKGQLLAGAATLHGNYDETPDASLHALLGSRPALEIHGIAHLAGTLGVDVSTTQTTSPLTVIKASAIRGRFLNQTVMLNGKPYGINYTETAVTLMP